MYYVTRVAHEPAESEVRGAYIKDTKDLVEEFVDARDLQKLLDRGIEVEGLEELPYDVHPRPQRIIPKLKMLKGADVEISKDKREVQYISVAKGFKFDLANFLPLGDFSVELGGGGYYFSKDWVINEMAFANFFWTGNFKIPNPVVTLDISNLSDEHAHDLYYVYCQWNMRQTTNPSSLEVIDSNKMRAECGRVFADRLLYDADLSSALDAMLDLYNPTGNLSEFNKYTDMLALELLDSIDIDYMPKVQNSFVGDIDDLVASSNGNYSYDKFIKYAIEAKNIGDGLNLCDNLGLPPYGEGLEESICLFIDLLEYWAIGGTSMNLLAILRDLNSRYMSRRV